jgi:tetratricopeptide (TPR) repeat protein
MQSCAAAWLGAGALSSLLAIAQWLWGWRVGVHHIVGTIGNPNRLAGVLLLLLPIAYWCIAQPTKTWMAIYAGIAGVICLAGIAVTKCHSAWLAVLAMALCLGVIWGGRSLGHYVSIALNRRKVLLAIIGIFAVLIGGVIYVGLKPAHLHTLTKLRVGIDGRVWLGKLSLEAWHQKPLFGIGLGGYSNQIALIQGQALAAQPNHIWTNLRDAHNQLLDIAVTLGLIGLLLFCALFGWMLWRCIYLRWYSAKPLERTRSDAALLAYVGLLLHSMAETPSLSVTTLLLAIAWLVFGSLPQIAYRQTTISTKRCNAAIQNQNKKDSSEHQPERVIPCNCTRFWPWLQMSVLLFVTWGSLNMAKQLYADWQLGRGSKLADLNTSSSQQMAIQAYERGLKFAADPSDLLFYRALALRELAHLDLATADMKRSFALLPTPERALELGNLKFKQNQTAQAISWYKTAIELHPHYARAYNNLGILYLQQKQYELAWRYMRRARSLRPGDRLFLKNWRLLPQPWRRKEPRLR